MASNEIAHNPGFYIGLGALILAILVLLTLVIVGISIAVRAKTGSGKGCGIVMAIAFGAQFCIFMFWLAVYIAAQFSGPSSKNGWTLAKVLEAKDNSCELSVPSSWIEAPGLNKDAVIGVKDPSESEYALVLMDSKQDYKGTLTDYAHDSSNRMRNKLTSPQMELPQSITIDGKSAIRQVLHGEINRLRIAYFNTYYEGERGFYQLICWSLDSKAQVAKPDFEKIAQSFRERSANASPGH
jgi:hypothetical protein